MTTLREIKNKVKELQDDYEFRYNLYIAVLAHVERVEGKNFDKRFFKNFTPYIETFLKMQGKDLTDEPYYRNLASMQYLEFEVEGKNISYLLNYGNKEIKVSEFKRLNTNYNTDESRYLDCRQLLQNTDDLKTYLKHIKRINESMKILKDLVAWKSPMNTVDYYLREMLLDKSIISSVTGLR